jgi:hypothetical protein
MQQVSKHMQQVSKQVSEIGLKLGGQVVVDHQGHLVTSQKVGEWGAREQVSKWSSECASE